MTAFLAGVMHPVVVPAHVVAIVALALLLGQQSWSRSVVIAYGVAVLLGLGAIAMAYVPKFTEEPLLALTAITRLLVALSHKLHHGLGMVLAAAMGLSLALDSPPDALLLMEANLTLVGTALGAVLLLLALLQGTARLRQHQHWQRIGGRIAGSWIAATTILVLALRLVR
jgi:urease accessory protein